MTTTSPQQAVLKATGRKTLEDALDWLAADNALRHGTDLHSLLQAVVALHEDGITAMAAVRRLRQVTASELDTASVIFDAASVTGGDAFRAALDLLARKSPDHTLATLNSSAVLRWTPVSRVGWWFGALTLMVMVL